MLSLLKKFDYHMKIITWKFGHFYFFHLSQKCCQFFFYYDFWERNTAELLVGCTKGDRTYKNITCKNDNHTKATNFSKSMYLAQEGKW